MAIRPIAVILATGLLMALSVACVPRVRALKADPRALKTSTQETALHSRKMSAASQQIVRLNGLDRDAREDRNHAIRSLLIDGRPSLRTANTIAELALLEAAETDDPRSLLGLYLFAAFHTRNAVSDGLSDTSRLLDPELLFAAELYNRAVSNVIRTVHGPARAGEITIAAHGPDREYQLTWERSSRWAPEEYTFLPVDQLQVQGLHNRHLRRGLGAPVVARPHEMNRHSEPAGGVVSDFERFYSLTALIDFDAQGEAVLRMVDPLEFGTVELGAASVPLESDFTAAIALRLGEFRTATNGESGMLTPGWFMENVGLYLHEPFREEKIPVVLIHGLAATGDVWAEMLNDLSGMPEIRDRYQFWVFRYPTGLPIIYSTMMLQQSLEEARQTFDPEQRNPNMDRMVLVGHSMGGLMSRLLTTVDRTPIYDAWFTAPLDQLDLTPAERESLRQIFFPPPAPYVKRLVFLAVPHQGSPMAAGMIGRFGSALARLPDELIEASKSIARANKTVLTPEAAELGRPLEGIETMAPKSLFIQGLRETRIRPDVRYHSIFGDRGKENGSSSDDGVVPYWSSHLDGAESEIFVPSNHIVQDHPVAIGEVRRILLEHLEGSRP